MPLTAAGGAREAYLPGSHPPPLCSCSLLLATLVVLIPAYSKNAARMHGHGASALAVHTAWNALFSLHSWIPVVIQVLASIIIIDHLVFFGTALPATQSDILRQSLS